MALDEGMRARNGPETMEPDGETRTGTALATVHALALKRGGGYIYIYIVRSHFGSRLFEILVSGGSSVAVLVQA